MPKQYRQRVDQTKRQIKRENTAITPSGGRSEVAGGQINGASIVAQIEHLNDTRMPLAQRQVVAAAIMKSSGNQHLQKVVVGAQRDGRRQFRDKSRTSANTNRVQRYQAGETGHGGIERDALSIQFSSEEIDQIYYGNWLRDFSQLPPKLLPLLDVLSIGEFGHPTSSLKLGSYVPSEHMDNPEGSGTIEDPEIQKLGSLPRGAAARKPFDDAFNKLSPTQQAEYGRSEATRSQITEASKRSGLPPYVERAKLHAKNALKEAVTSGRTPLGRERMGDALHAVEDYFSHSNFVDVCLWLLYKEGNVEAALLVGRMIEQMHGQNPALAGNDPHALQSHSPQIITGTYGPGANSVVSGLELLKSEIEHGHFTHAFIKGLIRLGELSVDSISSIVCGTAGAIEGGIGGAFSGAISGASQGFDEGAAAGYRSGNAAGGGGPIGEALGETEGIFEGALGAVGGFFRGIVPGAEKGAQEGSSRWSAACSRWGRGMLSEAELAVLAQAPAVKALLAQYLPLIDAVVAEQIQASGKQAKVQGLHGPTHSQIAKDAPDHPLFLASTQLARIADRAIGEAMAIAWQDKDNPGSAESVAVLVDTYVSDPSKNDWWRPTLTAGLKGVSQ